MLVYCIYLKNPLQMNFCSQMDGHQQCIWCGHVTGRNRAVEETTTRLVELKPCPWFAKMIKIQAFSPIPYIVRFRLRCRDSKTRKAARNWHGLRSYSKVYHPKPSTVQRVQKVKRTSSPARIKGSPASLVAVANMRRNN
jgi:hypothetical protein